jgi:hypothetical protein
MKILIAEDDIDIALQNRNHYVVMTDNGIYRQELKNFVSRMV